MATFDCEVLPALANKRFRLSEKEILKYSLCYTLSEAVAKERQDCHFIYFNLPEVVMIFSKQILK